MSRERITSNDVIKIVRKLGPSGKKYLYDDPNCAYDFSYTIDSISHFLSSKCNAKVPVKAKIYTEHNDYNIYDIEEVWQKFFIRSEYLIRRLNALGFNHIKDLPEEYFYIPDYDDDFLRE